MYGGGFDTLTGNAGNDYLLATAGNQDTAQLGVNALDMVLTRTGNNLVLNLHGETSTLTVQNWYLGTQYQTEVIKAQDGSTLANNPSRQPHPGHGHLQCLQRWHLLGSGDYAESE